MNEIMRTNLIVGDMLNGKDKIYFVEYTTPTKNFFIRKIYALTDMESGIENVIKKFPLTKYENLASVNLSSLNKNAKSPPKTNDADKQTNLFGELA